MNRKQQLLEFLAQSPNDSFLKFALALEFIKAGDDDSALVYFKDIITHDPDYTGTYYHLGKLYQRKNDHSLARQTLMDGIDRTKEKDPHTYAELRQALDELNEESE